MSNMDIIKIFAKNAGIAVADSLTFNMGSAIKNSAAEIKEYAKLTNDALYYLQVKTFLETLDLDQEEVNRFLEDNPDNQRLGIEVFKILEKTFLEKQAIFMAKAFERYVKKQISEEKLNQYFHVIEQLNQHILTQIERDLYNVENHTEQGLPRTGDDLSTMAFTSIGASKNQVLQTLGFLDQETKEQPLTFSGSIKSETIYKRTGLYLDFYQDLIEEE
ncbi:hypothetical protein [Acinetobacter baumannii]|uniref:hypothetical protein n=1 Tax=Acinetobacter baumannii TaxID=470 RepID=UPI000DE7696D|nr:hypothetical protein [Acinetobacter baumannii]MBF9262301.1 hypothetical protein [Acinetobacter baumannii]MDE3319605.1 hypothetical protein [Acinetobacter baumannii]MDX5549708.1 hypothetical protein [Acinetobacter baumannii]SSR05474.1 Uncharacterised protein [Acinetobacter baumannii]HCT3680074.1 hypothetical protein [Acinetobacter baumannii]